MNPEVARLRRKSAQRKQRKRIRLVRLHWVLAGALLLALIIQGLWALAFSPRFWIYNIVVNDTDTMSSTDVIRLMQVPKHSNYYRISLRDLADRIHRDPRVEQVTVRHGEIGVLAVEVRERQPICQLGVLAPALYMDEAGYVFSRPTPPATPIPIIEGLKLPRKNVLGTQLTTPSAKQVLACLREVQRTSTELAKSLLRVHVDENGWINMVLRQGTQLFIGEPDDIPFKVWCIRTAIIQASNEGYSLDRLVYINVRFVDKETGTAATYLPKNTTMETVEQ